jgi:hypothetical protein
MPAAAPTRWQPYAVYLLRLIQCVLYRIACARTREYTLSRRWANSASPNRLANVRPSRGECYVVFREVDTTGGSRILTESITMTFGG